MSSKDSKKTSSEFVQSSLEQNSLACAHTIMGQQKKTSPILEASDSGDDAERQAY